MCRMFAATVIAVMSWPFALHAESASTQFPGAPDTLRGDFCFFKQVFGITGDIPRKIQGDVSYGFSNDGKDGDVYTVALVMGSDPFFTSKETLGCFSKMLVLWQDDPITLLKAPNLNNREHKRFEPQWILPNQKIYLLIAKDATAKSSFRVGRISIDFRIE